MLQLSGSFLGRKILSLRTGGQVATISTMLINPNNLKIEGFYCDDRGDRNRRPILLGQDIRDIVSEGIVIDDYEVLCDPEELVRLEKIIELSFTLIDKPVVSDTKRRVGKVNDYAIDVQSLFIQKLYVAQSLVRNFSTAQLSIDRSQIIEITNRQIVVQDPVQSVAAHAPASAVAG
jgi:uncharacterized protein YrrD